MDIGIYTTQGVLEHKKRDGNRKRLVYCYWKLSRLPVKFREGDRVFFATDGKWQGYFRKGLIDAEGNIAFWSENWRELPEKLERKPFQGFTYQVPLIGHRRR